MKKTLLLFYPAFFLSFLLSAQQYQPMLDSVNVWTFVQNVIPVSPSPQSSSSLPCSYPGYFYNHIYTAQDTIIHSLTYKQLFIDQSNCIYGFLREDTAAKKVYFQDVLDSPEVVLYDFSMLPGDTINITFISQIGSFFPSGTYRLDSITNVTIEAGMRRAFHLNCISTASPNTLTWIEGLGNLDDIIYSYSINDMGDYFNFIGCPGAPHDFVHFVSCFEHNQRIYYDSCAYNTALNDWCFSVVDSCNYFNICGGIHEWNQAQLTVAPNPVQEQLMIQCDQLGADELDVSIYDLTGQKILAYQTSKNFRGNKINVDARNLTPGIYFLQLHSGQKSLYAKFVKQ